MTTPYQKDIFLQCEGDAWFERNLAALNQRLMDRSDRVCDAVLQLVDSQLLPSQPRILEVGCGDGKRGAWLVKTLGAEVYGIDPSTKAVERATSLGVNASVGTADDLPFSDGAFNLVIFGFCLYLCDRDDLFRIAQETHRVLADEAWIIIHDFYAKEPFSNPYHHYTGLKAYKMDYRKLFDWHPAYVCYSHTIAAHGSDQLTDDRQEWVAVSLLRKQASS